ncbi:sterol desaturase family protein [Oleiagrimonas citrea]|uniref:Alkylglycerol monooxygenase n=1 Tax=Oleiagrimonas citrea TaxID=1665687 RepID=A0A846ZMB5_9GAMM|nr:sterol desaturase family protein [Oleiagrimonas citrea]NKZ38669.1 sterol desaturase family protein [Oleiagrimonas citrea]
MNTAAVIMLYAIPGFFLLMAVEVAVAAWRGHKRYRLNDAINSIGLGILSQLTGVFTKTLTIGIYAWCATRLALFELPADSVWVWAGALLGYDFCYYWLHRMGHEVNVLWAAHVVHHQSECYNLSTALRQTSSGALFGWLFYLPLAVLGVPLEVFAVVALIDLLYQYWIHTEEIGRLGWFDYVFASPSNHRVHHAVNDRYVDRNYGGILILWDRLFGTFQPERADDPPQYGTRSPLRSWNPLWANAEVYWATWLDAVHARRWRDRLQVWLRRPGWRPADVAARYPKPAFALGRPIYDPPMSAALKVYGALQFLLLLGMALQFLMTQAQLSTPTLLAYFAYMALSLMLLGGVLEGRAWARGLEGARLVGSAVLALISASWFGASLPAWARGGVLVLAGVSVCLLWWVHRGRSTSSLSAV